MLELSQHRQRTKDDSTKGENAYLRLSRSGGGVLRRNEITEYQNPPPRKAGKRKKKRRRRYKKQANGKRQDESTKHKRNIIATHLLNSPYKPNFTVSTVIPPTCQTIHYICLIRSTCCYTRIFHHVTIQTPGCRRE